MNATEKKKTIQEEVIEALTTFKKPLSTGDLANLAQCHNDTIQATISNMIKIGKNVQKIKGKKNGHFCVKYTMYPCANACTFPQNIPISPEKSISPVCKKEPCINMPTRCFHYIMAKRSVTPCDIADLFDISEDRAAKIIKLAVEEHPNEIKISIRGTAK